MDQFIPVAINCSYTQNLSDKSDEFFCLVAEQGHYGGRTLPTNTRQGLYTCTTNGELLASVNTRDGNQVVKMMQQAFILDYASILILTIAAYKHRRSYIR